MHCSLIGLSCLILIVGINGISDIDSTITLDMHITETIELFEKCSSLKPAVLQKTELFTYCLVIDKCCEGEYRSQVVSLFTLSSFDDGPETQFNKVISSCINSTASAKINPWCSSFRSSMIPLWKVQLNSDAQKYRAIIRKYQWKLAKLVDLVGSSCTNEESHALLCLSEKKLMENCARKIVQNQRADLGYQGALNFIMKTKQMFKNLHEKLFKMFKNHTL